LYKFARQWARVNEERRAYPEMELETIDNGKICIIKLTDGCIWKDKGPFGTPSATR